MKHPDIKTATAKLGDAIAVHVKHMNGSAPTTGADGEKSQMEMMNLMKDAYAALTGRSWASSSGKPPGARMGGM